MVEKHYPTSELGLLDPGAESETRPAKPCCKLIDHSNELDAALHAAVTWCAQPEGHEGECSGPFPRVLEASGYAELRLVGLRNDEFANKVQKRNAPRSKR